MRRFFFNRMAFQFTPIVAMVSAVVLLGVLLALLRRGEAEEERHALIMDVLWVEQNMHFHLTNLESTLEQLAAKMGQGTGPLVLSADEARSLMANHPETDRIILRDAQGRVLAAFPPIEESAAEERDEAAPWRETFALAHKLGRATWGGAFAAPGRGNAFEVQVPVFARQRFAGMVVGRVSVDALLTHHVPWWVAGKYRIEIVDGVGELLGAKTSLVPADPGPSHQVRLEPPGRGMAVVATLYRDGGHPARDILAAAIAGLAVLAVSSLWAARRHGRRRLAAERALRSEHAFRKAMEDSLTVGLRARDLEGRITYANPAFGRMVGWQPDELVGLAPPMPYWLPEALEETYAMHRQVMAGEAPPDGFEIRFRRRDGEVFWALVHEAPLIEADGRHTGWMASVVDLTERKRAEELSRLQLETIQRTGRLITMGEMASTLAHELNQPLAAIASYNAGCLNRLNGGAFDPQELHGALTKLGVQAQRAGQIIRRVHDFVRKSDPKVEPCDLNRVVEDCAGFVAFDARRRGARIAVRPSADNPQVMADRILLEQVVLNLCRNGVEAMSATPEGARRLDVAVRAEAGRAVVSVADCGCGIGPEAAANLFQPFFTTKEEGMGMGLNICRSIIEFHQGRLWFEPHAGGGSVFQFSLPLRMP